MSALNLADAVLAAAPEASRSADATGNACLDVHASRWRHLAETVAVAGGQLDWLTGVDLGRDSQDADGVGAIQVVAMLICGDDAVLLRTTVGYTEALPSLSDLFASASWHERETAEMLGVTFAGGDPRRLLLLDSVAGHPLRRDYPLPARMQTQWPGAEPGRRARVPGINPEWQR